MKNNISRVSDHLVVSTLGTYFGYQMKSNKTQMLSSMIRYTLFVALQSLIGFMTCLIDHYYINLVHFLIVRFTVFCYDKLILHLCYDKLIHHLFFVWRDFREDGKLSREKW